MSSTEQINLAGKDWLTVIEAAHYCGVSDSQFRKNALAYGLRPKRFMGKQLYEKAALYAAIHGSEDWSTPQRNTAKAISGHAQTMEGPTAGRLALYEAKKKRR
ncbi:hypothetical protein [Dyella sp. EPa41]|uniref:hypothetical protein n=1 Tax=Dyella sp. EPa41 TaxID=1561194 RepID=UPI001F2247C2|nr:hypothetical protein [Dyella sp. EPa41]